MDGNRNRHLTRIIVLFFAINFLGIFNSFAQQADEYIPLKYSTKSYSKNKTKFYNTKINKYKFYSKDDKINKLYKDYLYKLYLSHSEASKSKQFIAEPRLVNYLNKILDTILKSNGITEKFEVVLTRYTSPNAFNMGDNRLYVNMGLFKLTKNEAQLAFVIAHELSHKLLSHVEQNFIAHQEKIKNKEFKKEIRDINRAKFNKLDKSIQFIKNAKYDFAKYSRQFESAADSFAVEIIKNTNYEMVSIERFFMSLENADVDTTEINYNTYFANKNDKIKDEWIFKDNTPLTFGDSKLFDFDEDSLKTHPDMKNRTALIKQKLSGLKYEAQNIKEFLIDKNAFDTLLLASDMEELELYKLNKRYSALVFYSLKIIPKYPNYNFLYRNVAENLDLLYKAINKHEVQKHIPIESEDLANGYNDLLRIIDRTTTKEFELIVKNFLNNFQSKLASYPNLKSLYNEYNK